MHALFPTGIGKLRTSLVFGLVFWAIAAATQARADDPPSGSSGCDCGGACGSSIFWYGVEPLPRDPWYFSTDAIAMQRLFTGPGPYATLGIASTGTVALDETALTTPFQGGVRMLLGHTFEDSPYQVEVSYYKLTTWDVSAQATDLTNSLYSPFTNFGFNGPNNAVDYNSLVQVQETSQLDNGEANLKQLIRLPAGNPTIELLIGVRHVGVTEGFTYHSAPSKSTFPVDVNAHTNNSLWGPQIGGIIEYGHQDVWLRVEGKAALCENDANRDLSASVSGKSAVHPTVFYDGTASVADVNATLLWHFASSATFRIGYQALWVDQLALAARNFETDVASLTNAAAPVPIDMGGHLVYHGPFAGLQVCW